MIEIIGNKIFLEDGYEIREYYTKEGIARALVSNECIQSLIYLEDKKRSNLAVDYSNYYNLPVELNPNGVDYLMLGGGSVSYPHHYLNTYKDKRIDIVEINSKCIEYSKKYFYLNELIEKNLGRLNIVIDDALKYISYTNKQYDYILIDLFNGNVPVKTIYNEENVFNLKKILKNNSVIVINYIINDESDKKVIKEITKITEDSKIITNEKYFDKINNKGNIIIILSNNKITIPNSYSYVDMSNIIDII